MNLIYQKGKDGKVTTILKYSNHIVGRVTTSDGKSFDKVEGFLWCWLLHINNIDKKKLYKMYDMCKKSSRVEMLKFLWCEHNKQFDLEHILSQLDDIIVRGN